MRRLSLIQNSVRRLTYTEYVGIHTPRHLLVVMFLTFFWSACASSTETKNSEVDDNFLGTSVYELVMSPVKFEAKTVNFIGYMARSSFIFFPYEIDAITRNFNVAIESRDPAMITALREHHDEACVEGYMEVVAVFGDILLPNGERVHVLNKFESINAIPQGLSQSGEPLYNPGETVKCYRNPQLD